MQRELEFLTIVRNYIELNQDEDFIKKERDNVVKLLEKYNSLIEDQTDAKKDYYASVYNPKKLRSQLRTLDYILS